MRLDVPNCGGYVNHADGFALQYGNPLNTVQNDTQIETIREHFFKMKGDDPGDVILPIGEFSIVNLSLRGVV